MAYNWNYLADFLNISGCLALNFTVSTMICTWLAENIISLYLDYFRLVFRIKYYSRNVSTIFWRRYLRAQRSINATFNFWLVWENISQCIKFGWDYIKTPFLSKGILALRAHRISFPDNGWNIFWKIFYSKNRSEIICKIAE